jgi:nitrous oxidase accessory protein NosD
MRAMSLFPMNRITDNDFAHNSQYVETARFNVLHVWSGNYWRSAPGINTDGDGTLSRAFRATGPVGMVAERGTEAPTLARAPAFELVRELQQTMPGLRFGGAVDDAPRAAPVHPDVLARLENTSTRRANSTTKTIGISRSDCPKLASLARTTAKLVWNAPSR